MTLFSKPIGRALVAAAGLALCTGLAGAAATTPPTTNDTATPTLFPPPGSVSKTINVDGHAVQIVVDVSQASFVAASPRLLCSVSVSLRAADDQELPAGLVAKRITLERSTPPLRRVTSGLASVLTFTEFKDDQPSDFRADPFNQQYYATSPPNFIRGARLKATLRLEVGDETRIIRMGTLRVRGSVPIIALDDPNDLTPDQDEGDDESRTP